MHGGGPASVIDPTDPDLDTHKRVDPIGLRLLNLAWLKRALTASGQLGALRSKLPDPGVRRDPVEASGLGPKGLGSVGAAALEHARWRVPHDPEVPLERPRGHVEVVQAT